MNAGELFKTIFVIIIVIIALVTLIVYLLKRKGESQNLKLGIRAIDAGEYSEGIRLLSEAEKNGNSTQSDPHQNRILRTLID